jgi:hypothetical protein
MGEAMRAIASGSEGPLLNPAGMTLSRQYVLEGMYGFAAEGVGSLINVSVVDSLTSRVSAGLYYSYVNASPKLGYDYPGGHIESATATREGHSAGLSLGIPLGERLALGATVKYLHLSTTGPLPQGVPGTRLLDNADGITFDVGLLLRLSERLNIAEIGYNLWDHHTREAPLALGLGVALVPTPRLSINFDTVIDFTYQQLQVDPAGNVNLNRRTTVRLGPGLEYFAGGKVPVRAGFIYDGGLPSTYLTLGLGYVSGSFGVDLSYRLKLSGGVENLLVAGVRLFVN